MTNNKVWMFARDLQALLCRCGENGETSVVSLSKDHSPSQVRVMYLYTYFLTELGRVGRENIWLEVLTYGPSATRFDLHGWEKNIFLSDQTQSIGILSCDRFEKFCVNLIKTRWTGARGTTTIIHCFFRVRTRKSQFIKKLFFLCYFRFSLEFLQKSRIRTGLDSSFWTGSRQPVRPCACQLSVWFSMGLRARCHMGHLINVLDDNITTYFYHLKKLQLITWMLFLCSMRKGWGFKRLEELSGRKQKLASLLKMINDLRKIKRIGKSQSWVSSLMILKEDNFGISYRNLSYSHRRQFFFSRRGTPT